MTLEFVNQGIRPKHLIVDQGTYFNCDHFKSWCKNLNIQLRFGAVKKHGSIAVVERHHKTMKELLRLTLVEEAPIAFQLQLDAIKDWYNEFRPHQTLKGATPNEVFFSRPKANEQPRIEQRRDWPRGSSCASPQVDIDGEPGDAFIFDIEAFRGHRFLPVIRIRRAA